MTQLAIRKTANDDAAKRKVTSVPISMIRTNPFQPRKFFSEENLFELAQSIHQVGLIQPITVRKTRSEEYELIAGERRLRACIMLGLQYIDAIVVTAYDSDSAYMAMIENLQRENLHFIEEAEGYINIMRKMGISQDELAKRVGKNQCTIANKIRILKLAPSVKRLILQHNLVERQARALLRLHDEVLQKQAITSIVQNQMNVKETESLIERMLDTKYRMDSDSPKRMPRIMTLTADARLFVNSFKDIVEKMKVAGFDTKYSATQAHDRLEISIVIPMKRR